MSEAIPRAPVRGRRLLAFFVLTFHASWILFAAGAVVAGPAGSFPISTNSIAGLIILLGVFMPSVVAFALTFRDRGAAGAAALIRQVLPRDGQARWYVFAVGYMAAIKLAVALLHRLAAGAWPSFGDNSVLLVLASILISTPVQAGEEFGWRGYALPGLAARFGLARASILLGAVWACWHLPFFFIPSSDNLHQSFPLYFIQVTGLSVAMAWLYWRTRGSLLPVMLMHATVNAMTYIVPSAVQGATNPFTLSASLSGWLTAALLWIGAGYFLLQMRAAPSNEVSLFEADPETLLGGVS